MCILLFVVFEHCLFAFYNLLIERDVFLQSQNVKAVFDAAIKVVLQPPKQKKKKKKGQKACSIL